MWRFISFVSIAILCFCLGTSTSNAVQSKQKDGVQPLSIGELEPKLDKKEVTIKFTVAKLEGVAQLYKEGQAPTFVIETESDKQENRLSVWIEGELANVLDRLEMGYLQDNQLKAGTTVVATGMIRVHTTDSHLFLFSITKWQNFRILPSTKKK
ncbi:MAG: hypothetical protein ABL921_06235 [Pirellula sp.]